MKPSRFQVFVEYLLDNLFDIVTIVVAGFLVIRHQFRPFGPKDIAELATWILAVLGLIAVSGLWDRNRRLRRIEKLSEESRDLVLRRVSGKAHASDFFLGEQRPDNPGLSQASNIILSGITLERALRSYMQVLGQRLVAGASIRVVLLEPEEALLQELTKKHWATTDYWQNRIQTSQELLRVIAGVQDRKGEIKVGYLPYIPSFGFLIIDPASPHGICRVNVYHHKTADPNPTFELNKSDDPAWYNFFIQQFEVLWNICRIETLPKMAEPATEK